MRIVPDLVAHVVGIELIKKRDKECFEDGNRLTAKTTVVGGIEPTEDLFISGREKDVALIGSDLGRKLFETTVTESFHPWQKVMMWP